MPATTHTIALPQRLDASVARASLPLLSRSVAATPAGAVCVLDASAVQRFDSAGLALLLACRRQAQQLGVQLHVQGWSNQLRALAGAYGVLPLLQAPDADSSAPTRTSPDTPSPLGHARNA